MAETLDEQSCQILLTSYVAKLRTIQVIMYIFFDDIPLCTIFFENKHLIAETVFLRIIQLYLKLLLLSLQFTYFPVPPNRVWYKCQKTQEPNNKEMSRLFSLCIFSETYKNKFQLSFPCLKTPFDIYLVTYKIGGGLYSIEKTCRKERLE